MCVCYIYSQYICGCVCVVYAFATTVAEYRGRKDKRFQRYYNTADARVLASDRSALLLLLSFLLNPCS